MPASKRGRRPAPGAAAAAGRSSLLSQVLCLEPVQGVLLGLSLSPPTPLHEAAEDIAALSLSGAVRGDDAAALWSSLAAAHACEAGAPEGLPACLGCGGLAGWKVKGLQALCRALTLPTSGTKPELLVSWWGEPT